MINIICNPVNSNCPINLPSSCVYYDGPSTTNGYLPNMKLTDLLLLINSKLSGVSSIVLGDSPTIDVQGMGITSNPYSFNLNLSLDENNVAEIHADGLYIPYLLYADSPSIDINGDGVAGSPLVATVKISATAGNTISVNSDGIYSSGGGTIPTLQQVTSAGNTSSNAIMVSGATGATGTGSAVEIYFTTSTGIVRSIDFTGGVLLPLFLTSSYVATNKMSIGESSPSEPTVPLFVDGNVIADDATAPNHLVTLSQLTSAITTPNLQAVTDEGATTTNSITAADSGTTYIVAGSTGGSNAATVMLQGAPDDASLRLQSAGSMSIDRNSLSAVHDLVFTANNGAVITNIIYADGRMSGADASNPDEFVTLSQMEATNNLQTVTDNGNETTNGIQILGDGNIPPASNRMVLFHSQSTGEGGIISYGSSTERARLSFLDDLTTQLSANGTLNISSSAVMLLSSTTLTINSGTPASFTSDGVTLQRARGADAIGTDEFVTLGQMTIAIPIVETTPIASTSVDNTYMNASYSAMPVGGRVIFTDLSDDATKVLIVNKITSTTWSANADTKLT